MSYIGNYVVGLSETPIMDKCIDCDGEGTVLEEVPMPHNFNRDIGYMDTKTVTCETCNGSEEVERLCKCGEVVNMYDGNKNNLLCEECV